MGPPDVRRVTPEIYACRQRLSRPRGSCDRTRARVTSTACSMYRCAHASDTPPAPVTRNLACAMVLASVIGASACARTEAPSPTDLSETAPAASAPAPDRAMGGAGRVPSDRAAFLDPISLIGIWSFDRTCASGDGMTLRADGGVSYDEFGEGPWAVDGPDRLVLILRSHDPGTDPDPLAERHVLRLLATAAVGDDLVGRLTSSRAGDAERVVNAKRCPSS